MKSKIQFDLGSSNEPIITIKSVSGSEDLRDKVANRFCDNFHIKGVKQFIEVKHDMGGSDESGSYSIYSLRPIGIDEILRNDQYIKYLSDERLTLLYNAINSEYSVRRYEADKILDKSRIYDDSKLGKDMKKAESKLKSKYPIDKEGTTGSIPVLNYTPNISFGSAGINSTSVTQISDKDNITYTSDEGKMPHSTGNVI